MPEPLILLHGIGSYRHVWDPVIGFLEGEREVHALDLPGFGDAPPLPAGQEPSPQALARAVADELDRRGLDTVHAAGNSLGGWVSLELGKLGRTRSICALSPAGFWRGWERWFVTASLSNGRVLSKAMLPVGAKVNASPLARRVAFAQFAARGDRMTAEQGAEAGRYLATCPGWSATLKAMHRREFEGGDAVPSPVTVAWAEKDRLLLPREAARAREALPHARHIVLAGCGHVPTYDDPAMVAHAILTSA